MHQKWKEMTGEFSKKSKTNTEKTYEKYGKIGLRVKYAPGKGALIN